MEYMINFPTPTLISINAIELEVFEAGRENKGNPIVLCHGWPEHAYSWRMQIPALVEAGYHVIVPNQRGYGNSSCPEEVNAYDIGHLTGDLVGLLDHYGYEEAVFVGHDWGANVVWGLALLHPNRVKKLISLSVPYLERGQVPWIEFLEPLLGPEYYMVHFNRKPGQADRVLDENKERFLNNLFRKNEPLSPPQPGNLMIQLAQAKEPKGDPVMTDNELGVFISAFEKTGFTPSINWYRNLDRNWHILGQADPIIQKPALMIYGDRDPVAQSESLSDFVPKVDVVHLDCGHWIQEEMPQETNRLIVEWLKK